MSLLSQNNIAYQETLNRARSFFRSQVRAMTKTGGFASILAPRFGILSLLADSTPMFAYDHEELTKRQPTAFTDGSHVYFSKKLIDEIFADGPQKGFNALLFIVAHELYHIALGHCALARRPAPAGLTEELVYLGQERYINSRLRLDLPAQFSAPHNLPGQSVMWDGFGKDEPHYQRWATMSAPDIAREAKKDGAAPSSDGHAISQAQMLALLKEIGELAAAELLGLDNPEKLAQQSAVNTLKVAAQAKQISATLEREGAAMPGRATSDAIDEYIGNLGGSKVDWKAETVNIIAGTGGRHVEHIDYIGDEYMIDPTLFGSTDNIWIGGQGPALNNQVSIAIIDTSGSMRNENLTCAASEVLAMIAQNGPDAPEIAVFFSDTCVRNLDAPLIVTPDNVGAVESGIRSGEIRATGRGGTILSEAINSVLASPYTQNLRAEGKRLESVIFFTDTGDAPPRREDITGQLPRKFIYAVPEGCNASDEFVDAVSSYAKVIMIEQSHSPAITI